MANQELLPSICFKQTFYVQSLYSFSKDNSKNPFKEKSISWTPV